MSDPPHEVMTWDELGLGTRELATAVRADSFVPELVLAAAGFPMGIPFPTGLARIAGRADGFVPELVLGIARGGLLVAGALGYALGIKNTFTMNVEFYTGIDERLDMPMILPPVPELVDLEEARVLIADDVADTGLTLMLVKDFCAGKVGEVPHRPLDRLPLERRRAGRRPSNLVLLCADRERGRHGHSRWTPPLARVAGSDAQETRRGAGPRAAPLAGRRPALRRNLLPRRAPDGYVLP